MSIKNLSDTIRAMMAAGCTPEQIDAVLKVHEQAEAEALEKQREKERLKKRRQRALSPNVPRDTQGHTGTPRDNGDPLSLNGFPPAPIYKNNTPPSLNPQTKTRARRASVVDDRFAEFWQRWPHKVGKPAAIKAWQGVLRRGVEVEQILAGVERYIRDKPPDRPWLNPATFLNQERFNDAPAQAGLKFEHRKPSAEELEEQERQRIAHLMKLAGIQETKQ